MLDAVELRVRLTQMVEEPAGRGDDDVDPAAKGVLLGTRPDAAEDRGRGDRCVDCRFSNSSRICAASSRVGVRMSARVVPRGRAMRRFRIGRRKAAVFPLPVMAQARTSRPPIAGGMAST
jgi:hypothetical protein